jgi:drug/metabolite transporter (DMT)-like permease
MQRTSLFRRRVLAFAAVYLLWGGSYLAIRFVVQAVPPFLAAGIRYSLSAMVLLAISFFAKGDTLPSRRQLLNCAGSGMVLFTFSYSIIYWAETRLVSWVVALLASTGVLWTYVAECVFLRTDQLRISALASLALGVAGMALLVGYPFQSGQEHSIVAVLAVLASAVSWSAMTVAMKQIDLPRSFVQRAGLQLAAAGLTLVPLACLLGEAQHLPGRDKLFAAGPLLGMAYLVIGGSVTAFTAFHWLLARESPSLVATSTYVNPIVAMMAGMALVHERYTATQLWGACGVLASVILIWRVKSSPSSPSTRAIGSTASLAVEAGRTVPE